MFNLRTNFLSISYRANTYPVFVNMVLPYAFWVFLTKFAHIHNTRGENNKKTGKKSNPGLLCGYSFAVDWAFTGDIGDHTLPADCKL